MIILSNIWLAFTFPMNCLTIKIMFNIIFIRVYSLYCVFLVKIILLIKIIVFLILFFSFYEAVYLLFFNNVIIERIVFREWIVKLEFLILNLKIAVCLILIRLIMVVLLRSFDLFIAVTELLWTLNLCPITRKVLLYILHIKFRLIQRNRLFKQWQFQLEICVQ